MKTNDIGSQERLASFPAWRDPKDKPPHIPGGQHSEDVLICMRDHGWIEEQPIKIGHVYCGHWRPRGWNGNFDDEVLGWMPLPPSVRSEQRSTASAGPDKAKAA